MLSLGTLAYVLGRYLSIVLITATNVGYFNHGFSPKACDHYFHIGPIFKVFQVMVSHAILGVRAYNIAQRNVWIGHALVLTYIAVVVVEWYSAVHNRIPLTMNGNCTVGSPNPHNPISAWSFYMAAMLYDFLALSISTYYLLKAKAAARAAASAASNLMKILLYDGLGYFVALTAVNMANIFLYRGNNYFIQTSGVSIGYAITSIMSQRIIIHAREAREKQSSVVASPPKPPTLNTKTSSMSSGDRTITETMANRDLTGDSPKILTTLIEGDIEEAGIDRSIIRGAE